MIDKRARFLREVKEAPENYLRLLGEKNDSLAVLFNTEDESMVVYKWSDKESNWSIVAAGSASPEWASRFQDVIEGTDDLSDVMKDYIDRAVEEGTTMCSTMETAMSFVAVAMGITSTTPRLMFNQRALEENDEEQE